MSERYSKINRILDMYDRLCQGVVIQKAEESRRFHIDQRSVQRDIDDLRTFFAERNAADGSDIQLIYDRTQKGFVLRGHASPLMTNSEILAITKILLDSRAFSKSNMSAVLEKLISGCIPQQNMKLVTDLLSNEKYHYTELTNPPPLPEALWDIAVEIRDKHLLKIHYQRQGSTDPVIRVIEPLSTLFSEYYFYLNAYIVEPDERGIYRHKHDYPAIFRIDRILDLQSLPEKFRLPYANRFQEGEFRKRVQFMYPGQLQKITLRYTGPSVDAILDRLPTAAIVSQDERGYIVEAEVYGKGVLMWLLSQGRWVEVLSPPSMRQEMRDTLTQMLAQYEES